MRRGARTRLAVPAAVALALVAASCSGASGTHAQQVAVWASAASLTTNDGYLVADVKGVAAGIARRELEATHTACDGLASDAGTAYGDLPTPDARLTALLNTAYVGFTNAAQTCTSTGSFRGAGFARYEHQVAAAMAALRAADARLRSLHVRAS